jgi:SAM-dependent methyltransferase
LSWRRELEALVRPPSGVPAVFVALARGIPTARVVHAGGAFFDYVVSRGGGVPRPHAAAAGALPFADASVRWLVLSFLGDASEGDRRDLLLAEVVRIVAPAAHMIVVDHNRPRRRAAALAALLRSPRPARVQPLAAWRRLAYPTAREVHAAGFTVDRLRLAAAERIQVIFAHREPSNSGAR